MKGMTNALPVLIDASTLATKSDISDMETKTHANATFATKTALTTLQNATKVAVENFAITESADKVTITTTAIDGATSKSEDIPAVTDTMAGIITADWFKKLKELWDDAHPVYYSLTINLTGYGNIYDSIVVGDKTVDISSNPTATFTDLQTNKSYNFAIYTSSQASVGFRITNKTPTSLNVDYDVSSDGDATGTIINTTSQNATLTFDIS